jgi:hypothetical protein
VEDFVLHLPEALPDEMLYSLLARIAAVNGMRNHLHVFVTLFGQEKPSSIIRISQGLEQFCSVTDGAYGSVESILARYTVFPLLTHLNVRPRLDAHDRIKQRVWLVGGEFDYMGNTKHEWRECRSCRKEDEARFGFSYWRRSHQLPTTCCCPFHGEALTRKALPGKMLHERFWLPHETDQHPEPANPSLTPAAMKMLADLGKDALDDQGEPYPAEVVRDTFLEMLQYQGFFTRAGMLKLNDCVKAFSSSICVGKCTFLIDNEIRRLLMGLTDSNKSVALQFYLLVVYWLFGTWQHFKERCKWTATFNYPYGNTGYECFPKPQEHERQAALKYYRGVCTDFMRANPAGTRVEFLRREYKSFRWLLRNDSNWLDYRLPLSPRGDNQADLFKRPLR